MVKVVVESYCRQKYQTTKVRNWLSNELLYMVVDTVQSKWQMPLLSTQRARSFRFLSTSNLACLFFFFFFLLEIGRSNFWTKNNNHLYEELRSLRGTKGWKSNTYFVSAHTFLCSIYFFIPKCLLPIVTQKEISLKKKQVVFLASFAVRPALCALAQLSYMLSFFIVKISTEKVK